MGSIQIVLARPDSGTTWSASIVAEQRRVIWVSSEAFDSADTAYYRAIGELVLRGRDDEIGAPGQGGDESLQTQL